MRRRGSLSHQVARVGQLMLQRSARLLQTATRPFYPRHTPPRAAAAMSTVADLNARIVEQGNRVRQLKADKAPAELVQPEVLSLKDLKAELAKLSGAPVDKKGGAPAGKKAAKFTLKTAKVRPFVLSGSSRER